MQPYLLWFGPILRPEEAPIRPAMSPAANNWQLGLVRALCTRVPIRIVGHVPEPIWPRGRPHVGMTIAPGIGRDNVYVKYFNLPGVRGRSLSRAYTAELARALQVHGAPAAVFTYNDQEWNVAAGTAALRSGIPWICVVADAPGEGEALQTHEQQTAPATGRVFLSWGRFCGGRGAHAMHLDGGIDELLFDPADPPTYRLGPKRVVVYSGSLNRWAGVSELIEAFGTIRSDAVELWICGPGSSQAVQSACARDSRIRFFGLLDDRRLRDLQARADVFVNPRPPHIADNRSNFPSKLLDYLRWGKPIVSTWTDGLAPEYEPFLFVADSTEPAVLGGTIERTLQLCPAEVIALRSAIATFLTTSRTWRAQADRLLGWLGAEVGVRL